MCILMILLFVVGMLLSTLYMVDMSMLNDFMSSKYITCKEAIKIINDRTWYTCSDFRTSLYSSFVYGDNMFGDCIDTKYSAGVFEVDGQEYWFDPISWFIFKIYTFKKVMGLKPMSWSEMCQTIVVHKYKD